MAAAKWKIYDSAKLKLGQGIILLNSHTFKCALFSSTSNANTLTHDELADLTNEVPNGFGYTTGGYTLTCTWTNSSGTITFDSDDPFWDVTGGGEITAKYAVIYDDTVAGDPLIAVCNLSTTQAIGVVAISGEELKIIINSLGIFTLSGATTD